MVVLVYCTVLYSMSSTRQSSKQVVGRNFWEFEMDVS